LAALAEGRLETSGTMLQEAGLQGPHLPPETVLLVHLRAHHRGI
jgi:hypothetical protein